MKKDNKKALYENIMTSVAKEVKKALNEYGDWTTTTTLDATAWDKDQSDSDFVDLGLSVKWAKYNLGAIPDEDAEDWYGEYYAWGETEPKSIYAWNNYKFSIKPNKYNDEIITLTPQDDAASSNCGRPWRMPTRAELKELMTLPNHWITNYKGIKGLNGRVFKGKNENQLFIPAAGYCFGSGIGGDARSYGGLWSSNLNLSHTD